MKRQKVDDTEITDVSVITNRLINCRLYPKNEKMNIKDKQSFSKQKRKKQKTGYENKKLHF